MYSRSDALEHIPEDARLVPERLKAAPLDDLAVVHDQNFVTVLQGAEPVGNGDHRGAAGAAHGLDLLLDVLLGGIVQGRGSLVQDENLRLAQEDPRQGDPLPLAAGKVRAALGEPELILPRQRRDDLRQPRLSGRLLQLPGLHSPAQPVADIAIDRVRDQEGRLRHQRHYLGERRPGEVPQGRAAQGNLPLGLFQLVEHLDERGLAAAAGAGNAQKVAAG